MRSSPITSWQIHGGKYGKEWQTLFSWDPKSLRMVTAAVKLKDACPWKKSYDKPRQCIKKQRHHFVNKGLSSQSYGFSSSHVQMWMLDHKEGWAPKNWCFWSVVLEKTLRVSGNKENKPVSLQSMESLSQTWLSDWTETERKSILNIHWRDWCWSCNTLAIWCKEPTHWKRPWCWERLRTRREGGSRG